MCFVFRVFPGVNFSDFSALLSHVLVLVDVFVGFSLIFRVFVFRFPGFALFLFWVLFFISIIGFL